MKIWFISDTHERHMGLSVPHADMVICCGDEANPREPVWNSVHSIRFFEWFSSLPMRKVFVPGNHSTAIEKGLVKPKGCTVLIDKLIRLDGLSIYGSPWTPSWGEGWAYMKKRNKMHQVWESMPDRIDILVTHGPPKGILDRTRDRETGEMISVGCKALRNRVDAIKPLIHCFGHIHDERGIDNYGVYSRGRTHFINCSVCDNRGNLKHGGVVLDV